MYVRILLVVMSPEADLRPRPSMQSHSRLCITAQKLVRRKLPSDSLAISRDIHNRDREKRSGLATLNNVRQGQNLGSTSGEAKFVAH